MFVNEEVIGDTIKHYFKFEAELLDSAKKAAPKNAEVKPPTTLSYMVMNNKLISKEEV